jgi:predicted Zn-dependent peptidase
MPGRRTVTAGVWVGHGAAHDPEGVVGATHLVEHLTLRRCGSRSRQSLSELVDRLGGEVDAWTGIESMGVSVRTTVDALTEALALLCDAILAPTFDAEDVELEKRVAQAELELVGDDPVEQVGEAILRAAWGPHPLARPVIGTRESVASLDPDTLRRHHAAMIRPGRVLAAVAGDVQEREVAAHLAQLPLDQPMCFPELPPLAWSAGQHRLARPGVDQVHVRLAFPAVPVHDPAVPALTVLSRVLGVGASSRLFQRLREEEGLTYDIWSALVLRRLGGLLEVGWASAPDAVDEVWQLVLDEVRRLAEGVTAHEVEVAKESAARALIMDAESTAGMCAMDVGEVLERGRRFDLDAALAEINSVRPSEVTEVASRVLRFEDMASALCGPEGVAQRVA